MFNNLCALKGTEYGVDLRCVSIENQEMLTPMENIY